MKAKTYKTQKEALAAAAAIVKDLNLYCAPGELVRIIRTKSGRIFFSVSPPRSR